MSLLLDIHGLVIACEAAPAEFASELLRPYRWFQAAEGTPTEVVRVHRVNPPYETFPPLAASHSTPRNVVYEDADRKIIDYFGRGVVLQDLRRRTYDVYSRDENLLREIVYLLVLSLLGQHCDRVGRLRIHALALSQGDRVFLFMMPSGSGKSTLAFGLLEAGGIGYLSDDDPLFDPACGILPFPRALGILDPERLSHIPAQYVSRIDRMEFGTKFLVDVAFWKDRIDARVLSDIVLVDTRRVLAGDPTIASVSRWAIFRTLWRDAVLGIGLYQGLEFLVSRSSWELIYRVPVLARRLRLAATLARRAKAYRLTANRDAAATLELVRRFMTQEA